MGPILKKNAFNHQLFMEKIFYLYSKSFEIQTTVNQ